MMRNFLKSRAMFRKHTPEAIIYWYMVIILHLICITSIYSLGRFLWIKIF